MRVTMGMASKQYYKNLNASYEQYAKATSTATTYRKFDTASENPIASLKTYQLKQQTQENSNYQSNTSNLLSQLGVASSTMTSIQSVVKTVSSSDCIQAITGTMQASDRTTIATKLRTLQASIVSDANTKYAGSYIFGGADTSDVPFSVDDSGNLLYRGINVTTGEIAAGTTTTINGAQIVFGKDTGNAFNGYTIKVSNDSSLAADGSNVSVSGTEITVKMNLAGGKTNEDLTAALKSATGLTDTNGNALDFSGITMSGDSNTPLTDGITSPATGATNTIGQDGLKALANEATYVDIGSGLSFNPDGSIDTQSVFNSAIPGISFLGYGSSDGTSSGISNNLYNLMGQIADQLDSSDFSIDKIQPYLDAFNTQADTLTNAITKVGTNTNYLTSTQTRLTTVGDTTSDELDATANVDTVDAYEAYSAASYAYQAAIKVGTDLLQSTLLDYMR